MKTILLAAGLVLAPALAYAEIPEWAAPETTKAMPANQLKPIADADQAARNRIFPTVPDSVPADRPQGQEKRSDWPWRLHGLPHQHGNGPATIGAAGRTARCLYRP